MVYTKLYLVYTGMYQYERSIATASHNQHMFFSLLTPCYDVVWQDKYEHIFKYLIINLKCDKTQRQWNHLYCNILRLGTNGYIPVWNPYPASGIYRVKPCIYKYGRVILSYPELLVYMCQDSRCTGKFKFLRTSHGGSHYHYALRTSSWYPPY